MVVNVFKTEADIYSVYPKTRKYDIKDIFSVYWDDFLIYAKDLTIRDVVHSNINKMLNCKTPTLGFNLWQCPSCNHQHAQFNTCKSRFCNSCGVKYSKERTLHIMTKLIDVKHRHMVFTIPDILWDFFREDRNRLNLLFDAVNITLSSWFKKIKKSENFKPGFLQVLHTYGRDNKWHPHIHCLIAEATSGNNEIRKIDFFPYDMLRKRFQKVFLDLLEREIGKISFRNIKNFCYTKWDKGFFIHAKKNEFKGKKLKK